MCQAPECHRWNSFSRHMFGFRKGDNEETINDDVCGGFFPNGGGTRGEESQDTLFQDKERDDGFYEEEHCSVTWRKMCLLSQCT